MKIIEISIIILSIAISYLIVQENDRINKLEQHMEIVGKSIQNLDYEISVLADLQKQMNMHRIEGVI